MSELLSLNAFPSINASLSNFKAWRLPVAVIDLKSLYELYRQLSRDKIADCVFHGGFVYFKGEPEDVKKDLSQFPNIYLGAELNEVVLSPSTDINLIKALLYSAFERNLRSNNWRAPLKGKKAIPPFDKKHEEFCLKLNEDTIVLYGLKYMFEPRPDNSVLLWLDIYPPLWSITNKRRLTRSEISGELKKVYVERALLQPKERFHKLLEILNILFAEEKITIEFCDGTSISILKKNREIPILQEGRENLEHFQWIFIDEPFLRFKFGYSKNPRRIVSLNAYSYDSIKKIPVKAVVAKPLKEEFVNLLKGILWELSGRYMAWPGFSKVTGAEILFDEKNDIVEIEDIGDKTAVFQGLIKASSEAKENTVIFIVLPTISREAYYTMKAEALRRGIHTQVVLKDTLTKEPLEFTLMNIAVALYTKAGGIPWILREPLILTRGLFVGISFHIDHQMKNIYYGVMEVFDKYGAHLICRARMYKCPHRIRSVKGLFIPREDVEKILSELIMNYKPREIIFHKSAPFHNEEKETIEKVCKQYNIDYYLVHIEGANPYRVYAPHLNFTPLRGTIIFDSFNTNRAIIMTTGQSILDYGRTRPWSGIGTPRPLEITIEKGGDKRMLLEISKQILALTKLDWNTTEVSVRLPITLKYPRKAARFAKYFEGIEEGLVSIADFRDLI